MICAFLQALAVPSVAFEPRFRGSFRNLMYLQTGAGAASPEKQEMMAYKVVMICAFCKNKVILEN